jgi:tetratricopeptide (TPR) repeat protein
VLRTVRKKSRPELSSRLSDLAAFAAFTRKWTTAEPLFSLLSVLKSIFQPAWKNPSWKVIPLCLFLFGLVFWTFLPSLHGGFIDIDDGVFVIRNSHINLTWANVAWVFCHTVNVNWTPLTAWSFILDHQLYGLKPWGYHLTNVLLHAFDTVLVFLVLRRMMGFRPEKSIEAATPQAGATWRSLMVAGLFGLHPLRVESVAWISERKDVLSVAFWMLTLWAYTRYAQRVTGDACQVTGPRKAIRVPIMSRATSHEPLFYWLALLFFALSLMSKPMVVTLPCVLLLLDFWPLERWRRKGLRDLLVEKAPFFLLSAIVSVVTYVAQRNSGVTSTSSTGLYLSFGARLENALVSYGRYLGKLFWPADLCALYPYPDHWPAQKILFAGLLVLSLSVLVFAMRRQRPYLLTGWLWYLGTLVPVLGLVSVGPQAMADRYILIPSIGILIIVVWGVCQMTRGWHYQGTGLGAVGGVLALVCIGLTRHQIGYWADGISLWRRAVMVTENNYDAHNWLGCALFSEGHMDEAIREFQEVVRLNPGFAEAYHSLGHSFAAKGQLDEAMACYQKALEIRPDYIAANDSLDSLLLQKGQADQVIIHCQKALELEPDDETAQINLGSAFLQKGNVDEAIIHYQKALQIKPDYAEAHINLGTALCQKGNVDEAIVHYQKALEIQPGYVTAHNTLGGLLFQKGQVDEAIIHYQKALQIKPDYAEAHINLGTALFQKGNVDEAIVHFQKALQIKPDYAEADYILGDALNSQGRFDEAIVCLQKALEINPNFVEAHYNLGFALCSKGRLDEAIRELRETLRLKPDFAEARSNLTITLGLKEQQARQPTNSSKP